MRNAYGAFVAFIGAVAEALAAALPAAIAELSAEFADAIAAFASEAAVLALSAVLSAGFLQAATETAATAAPTIRIVRSVPEVMFLVPSG